MQTPKESSCESSCSCDTPNFIARVRSCVFVTLLLSVGILKGLGADDSTPPSEDKFSFPWEKASVNFGGFVAAFESTLGFGLTKGPSVEIKGEDGLGLDSSLTVFRVDAMYRPGKSRRHQVDFSYAAYHRDASKTLSEEIDLGEGQVLPIGANVSTVFDFDIIRGTYSYAILQDDRVRLALGLGVYAVPVRYGLKIDTSSGRSEVNGADITLPLPSLALRAEFQLMPKLFFSLESNFMYMKFGGFKGSLIDNTIGLEYRAWKHFGFGLAYSGLSVGVEQEDLNSDYPGADFIGNVDVRYNGLLLYGKLSF